MQTARTGFAVTTSPSGSRCRRSCNSAEKPGNGSGKEQPLKYELSVNITVDVPNDWSIHEPGNLVELIPPDESGALHITVLDRDVPGFPLVKKRLS